MTRQLQSYGEYVKSGVLKDISSITQELGFSRPVAVEAGLYDSYFVAPKGLINFGQTTSGRISFVLETLRRQWRLTQNPLVSFDHSFLMGDQDPWLAEVQLSALLHYDDARQEVVTIFTDGGPAEEILGIEDGASKP